MGDMQRAETAQGQQAGQFASLARLDLLGFSFHLAWLCLFMYDVMPGFMSENGSGYSVLNPIYLFSMISLVAVLVFGMLRTRTFMIFARSKAGAVAAPIACALGTLCYTLTALGVIPQDAEMALLVGGGILTGASSAVMAAHWASVFGRAQARAFILNFMLILTIVLVACLAVTYLFPTTALAVATLLPLASGACLVYADSQTAGARHATAAPRDRGKNRPILAGLVAGVVLLGFSTGCLPELSGSDGSFDQVFYSISTVIVLAMVAWLVAREEKEAVIPLFVVPLAVLLVFALPFVRFTASSAADVLYIMGNASIELMLMFAAVLFALLFDFSCARTYMMVRVAMAVSDFAGATFAGAVLAQAGDEVAVQLAGTAILVGSEVVIGALLLTYLLLRKKSLPAPELNRQAAGVDGDAAGTGEIREGSADEPKATQTRVETQPAKPAADQPAVDPTDSLIQATVERYGLSPREADVLGLLVAGDSTAQIQDKLCIAPGTFNYHMRNIYTKLDVHSRQELLVTIYNQAKQ